MTRIPAVSPANAGPMIKLSYWYTKRRFGEVPEPFAVAANYRKLFFASAVHEALAEKAATVLPVNIRDLAVYRVAGVGSRLDLIPRRRSDTRIDPAVNGVI